MKYNHLTCCFEHKREDGTVLRIHDKDIPKEGVPDLINWIDPAQTPGSMEWIKKHSPLSDKQAELVHMLWDSGWMGICTDEIMQKLRETTE